MLSVPRGQSCEEIATLLVEIAETSHPNMRYQTNEGMKQWIAEKLVDPAGMTEYHNNLQFIKKRVEEE
jgi:hypothetical protein